MGLGAAAAGEPVAATVPIDLRPDGNDRPNGVAVAPDGKVVIAGTVTAALPAASFHTDVGVVRLTAAGAPDPTFGGGDGIVTMNNGDFDSALAVEVQSDHKIVIGGGQTTSGSGWSVYRLSEDGTPDAGFGGGDGLAQTPFGGAAGDRVSQLAVLGDGRILATGTADANSGAVSDLALAQYES